MNQSNKALRGFDKLFSVGGRTPIEVTFSTGLPPEGKILQMPYSQFKALVTNHIKGALPEKNSEEIPPVAGLVPEPMVMANGWAREYQRGYNQALDEVQSILEEVSNADQ